MDYVYGLDSEQIPLGVMLGGMIYDNDIQRSGFTAYSVKKTFETPLDNVVLEDIGIYNERDVLLDLSSGDASATGLIVGCDDFTCRIRFSNF